jgi:hypothetical protein
MGEAGSPGRPPGGVVAVVGPDGAGKTTLCQGLVEGVLSGGPVLVLANRRGARGIGVLPHRAPRGDTRDPHRDAPYPSPVSTAKLVYLAVDHLLTWATQVRPFVRRGGWVVIERGWWDVTVDPARYRLVPSRRLGRALTGIMPAATVVLVLGAPAEVLRARKPQLPAEEIERQLRAWPRMLPTRQRRAFLDASRSGEEVLAAAAGAIAGATGSAATDASPSTAARAGRTAMPAERAALWLPLLRRLAGAVPDAVVWKNADAALRGEGDVDLLAPRRDWPVVSEEFGRWADRHGLAPRMECRHTPGGLFLAAVDPEGGGVFELDVKARLTHRGAALLRPADLVPAAVVDGLGVRRLRPGAEGVLKLVVNGTHRTGAPRVDRLGSEAVAECIAADPDGVELAAGMLGAARRPLEAQARHLGAGGWSRPAALAVEAWCRARALVTPQVLLYRAWFRAVGSRRCAGLKQALRAGRQEDREVLAASHPLTADPPAGRRPIGRRPAATRAPGGPRAGVPAGARRAG